MTSLRPGKQIITSALLILWAAVALWPASPRLLRALAHDCAFLARLCVPSAAMYRSSI